MIDYQTLSTTPTDEPCASVGTEHYHVNMRAETLVYRNQLIRQHGPPPANAYFSVHAFQHDFGTYHELCINYNDEDGPATSYAFKLETDLPEKWDDTSIKELKNLGYPVGQLEKAVKPTKP